MAQHDYTVDNGSGSVVRADINAAFDAIVSHNSGATAPATTFAYMLWADTTAGVMKLRNGANTTWLDWFNLDGSVVDGSIATNDLAANAVTNAKFRQSAGLSLVGRSANTTGDVADITAANDGEVMRRSGTTIGFGTVATAGLAANAATNAKLAQMAQNTIKGRVTASTGDPEDLTASQVKTILALVKADVGLGNVDNTSDATKWAATATLTNKTFDANGTGNSISNIEVADFAANVADTDTSLTANSDSRFATQKAVKAYVDAAVASGVADGDKGDIVVSSGGTVWTVDLLAIGTTKIAANAVTNAKAAQMAVNTIKGRITAGTGDPEDLTAANVKTILALTKSDVGLSNVDNTSDISVRQVTYREYTGTADTWVIGDAGNFVGGNNAAANNMTIPPNSSVAFPINTVVNFGMRGAGQTALVAGAGVTLFPNTKLKLFEQGATGSAIKIATDTWWIFGNLKA